MQLGQVSRPLSDTAWSIATAAVVGAALGRAVGGASKPVTEMAQNINAEALTGMADVSLMQPGNLSAATARGDIGGLKKVIPLVPQKFSDWAVQLAPNLRVINQKTSAQGRWMMQLISNSGFVMEGNKVGKTAPGGDVESAVKQWYFAPFDVFQKVNNLYAQHWLDSPNPSLAGRMRAGVTTKVGKYTKQEFREEVARAIREGGEHTVPQVKAAAKYVKERVLDPMAEAAVTNGILKIPEKIVGGDKGYLMRVWDRVKIGRNPTKLIAIFKDDFSQKLQADFQKRLGKYNFATGKDVTRQADLTMDEARAQEQLKFFQEELKGLKEKNPYLAEEDEISDLRSLVRLGNEKGDTAFVKAAQDEIKKIEEKAGPAMGQERLKRQAVQRRIANLSRNRYLVGNKLSVKLSKIERAEEDAEDSLLRLVRSGRNILNKLDDLSDDELDKAIVKLKQQFNGVSERLTKTETRLRKALDEPIPEFIGVEDPRAASLRTSSRDVNGAIRFRGKVYTGADHIQAMDAIRKEFKFDPVIEKELEDAEFGFVKTTDEVIESTFAKASADNARLDDIFAKIEDLGGSLFRDDVADVDVRIALRGAVQEGLDAALYKTNQINLRRGERIARLRANAKALDPKLVDQEAARIGARIKGRELDFREAMRVRGADDVDIAGGHATFDAYAEQIADELVSQWLMRSTVRLGGVDAVQGPRGPELARVLDIETKKIEEFLENDYEKVIKSSVRTLAPDIELGRKFNGDVTLAAEFQKLKDEQIVQLKAIDAEPKLTPEQKAKRTEKLNAEYDGIRRDLQASIDRLRHTYGLPADADAIGSRLGTIAGQVNVLRLMGGVVVSSISDPFRGTMKYGLTSTFGDGFGTMITNWKAFKMGARETKLAGSGLDVMLHTTRNSIFDVLETLGQKTRGEKGLEYLTSKMGLIAGFDYWTAGIKQLIGVQANLYLSRAVRDVVEGKSGTVLDKMALSAKPVDSVEFLAKLGIDPQMARMIWQDMTKPGGGEQVNGAWMPNTEAWTAETKRVWRQALAGEVDRAIITPGLERPLWMNRTGTGRVIGQFRSFGMSSTVNTLMAGLQARDAAALQGALLMLGMGALSKYLWAVSVGGEAYEEMMNMTLGEWADEAIDRSGVLGIVNDLQRFADHIPLLMNNNLPGTDIPARYLVGRFGEQPATRGEGAGIASMFAGPTFGGGFETIERILTGIDDPTRSTVHQIRLMFPFQNHTLFRQAFDAVEDALGNATGIPERRGSGGGIPRAPGT